MTAPKIALLNNLEQILSTDWNRVGALAGKAAMDALIFAEASFVHLTPRSVVLNGLNATIGAGLSVDISAGSLARFEVAAGVDASKYELGTLQALENVTFSAADFTNPRIDLIHGTPASNDTDSFNRNILVLPGRTVVSTSVSKTREPALTLAVEEGTATGSPSFPAAPAGSVALWYVLIPANAPTFPIQLMDARVQFNPAALSRAHHRVDGLYAGHTLTSLTDIIIRSGRALVDGAVLEHSLDQTFSPATSILSTGVGTLDPDTEYSIYAVAKGSGNPVGKAVTDGFIPILEPSNPPDPDGRPSSPITYRPLIGFGADVVVFTTSDALYLGTLHTDGTPSGQFQSGGDGIPLNRDGTSSDQTLDLACCGFEGRASFWMRPPILRFVDADTVNVGPAAPVIGGQPGTFGGGNATMTGNLLTSPAPEAAEAASTFYYIYLRPRTSLTTITRGTIRHYELIISVQPPDTNGSLPIPESPFFSFEYRFVGSFFNDASSNIVEFQRDGHTVLFIPHAPFALPPGGGDFGPSDTRVDIAVVTATTKLGSFCPKSSRIITASMYYQPIATSGSALIFHRTGNTISSDPATRTAASAYRLVITVAGDRVLHHVQVVVDANEQFEITEEGDGGTALIYRQQGYLEDIENPLP